MLVIDAERISAVLTPADLVEALRGAFTEAIVTPVRHHHPITRIGEPDAMLLLMPAWHGAGVPGGRVGVKVVSVVPGNAGRNKPTVVGSYLLLSGQTGEPLAVLDGRELTLRRTAAASALAASYLARPDATSMVMVGAGSLAPYLIAAHAAVRPIERVAIWNRSGERASALAAQLDGSIHHGRRITVTAADDLADALAGADLASAATMSTAPLILGADLPAGIHIDLVGGFTPGMREADDAAIARAEVYVDTRAGTLAEAGDIVQPIAAGVIGESDIRAELAELCRGEKSGRSDAAAITVFKSVGTALEDLAAASLAYDRIAGL
jgi:ornithine cyclodeaminase/alanine dehydrogenase-like protein (mu-crystallin family)